MRDDPTDRLPKANPGLLLVTESATLSDPPDPNFLRHQHALNHQLTMTPMEILRPTIAVGTTTLSHW